MTYRFNYKNKFQPVSLEQEESPTDDKSNKNPFRAKTEPNTKSSIEFDDQPIANLADEGDDDVVDAPESSEDLSQTTDKPMSKVSFTEFLQVMSKAFATAAQSFTGSKSEDVDFKDISRDFSSEDNLDDVNDDNISYSDSDEFKADGNDDFSFDDQEGDDSEIEKEGEDFFDEEGSDGEFGDKEGEPDRQGDVRYVKGAHLVFRREDPEEGTFEELWIFNTGKDAERKSDSILRDILAGTEIDPSQIRSEDGTQTYSAWSVGNAQMVHVKGLPS